MAERSRLSTFRKTVAATEGSVARRGWNCSPYTGSRVAALGLSPMATEGVKNSPRLSRTTQQFLSLRGRGARSAGEGYPIVSHCCGLRRNCSPYTGSRVEALDMSPMATEGVKNFPISAGPLDNSSPYEGEVPVGRRGSPASASATKK
ncbi:MAG: hypothetical protein IJY31_06345 [Muribaculaceae bacterium]|nr:hypothetical protein [Muribaculaceae bacterium]